MGARETLGQLPGGRSLEDGRGGWTGGLGARAGKVLHSAQEIKTLPEGNLKSWQLRSQGRITFIF